MLQLNIDDLSETLFLCGKTEKLKIAVLAFFIYISLCVCVCVCVCVTLVLKYFLCLNGKIFDF